LAETSSRYESAPGTADQFATKLVAAIEVASVATGEVINVPVLIGTEFKELPVTFTARTW
jgi:hypothetical protein